MLAIYKRVANAHGLSVEKLMSIVLNLSHEMVLLPAGKLTATQRKEFAAAHKAAAAKLAAARLDHSAIATASKATASQAKALLLAAPDKPRARRSLVVAATVRRLNGSGNGMNGSRRRLRS